MSVLYASNPNNKYNYNHQADFCLTDQCMAKIRVTVQSAAMYF